MNLLTEIHHEHQGKTSDKWALYINQYDKIFSRYRNEPITILEIGIQNGGSLEIMGKYFQNAHKIIGCDINKDCDKLRYEDPRIKIVVGDVNSKNAENDIISHSKLYDIIIDDGSHLSGDIIIAFSRYFRHLRQGGTYIIEDLHCSYWKEFDGGLFYPYSAISFFKRLTDVINHEHWGVNKERTDILKGFSRDYNITFNENCLSEIHSIEFLNSLCIVHKSDQESNLLGTRLISGQTESVAIGHHQLHSRTCEIPSQLSNPWSSINRDPEMLYANMSYNISDKVDLIIPYFNGHDHIEQAVTSALQQTVCFSEIFVVDDGSTEDSSLIARNISNKYGLNYLWKPNGGQGSARNLGVKQSEAGLICFLDQDDFLLPDHNEVLIAEFNTLSGSRGWVSSNFACSDQRGLLYQIKANPVIGHQITNLYQMVDHDLFMLPSGTIISTEALRAVGGFDERFKGYEDDDLFIRLFRAGYSFKYIDKDTYVWRMHEAQTSSSIKMLYSRHKFIDKWMSEDFGDSIDEYHIKNSIIKRFRPALARDILYGKDDAFIRVARDIVDSIRVEYREFMPYRWSIAFLILSQAPRPVSRGLYHIYKTFKR